MILVFSLILIAVLLLAVVHFSLCIVWDDNLELLTSLSIVMLWSVFLCTAIFAYFTKLFPKKEVKMIKYGKIYVWKDDKVIRACIVHLIRKTYIVLSDGRSNAKINERIDNWAKNGYDVIIGPVPMLEIVKDVNARKTHE